MTAILRLVLVQKDFWFLCDLFLTHITREDKVSYHVEVC